MKLNVKDWIPEEPHLSIANDMADKIHSMDNKYHLEMLEQIRQRLIKLTQNQLNGYRKFNK